MYLTKRDYMSAERLDRKVTVILATDIDADLAEVPISEALSLYIRLKGVGRDRLFQCSISAE